MADFTPAPVKPAITLDLLQQVDVRVGTIEAVADLASSNKLLKLTVDFGDHRRTILAGLKKERPDTRALVGLQTLFVINLEPKRMAGATSEGMLFDVGYADGIRSVFAVPEAAVPNGARAG